MTPPTTGSPSFKQGWRREWGWEGYRELFQGGSVKKKPPHMCFVNTLIFQE